MDLLALDAQLCFALRGPRRHHRLRPAARPAWATYPCSTVMLCLGSQPRAREHHRRAPAPRLRHLTCCSPSSSSAGWWCGTDEADARVVRIALTPTGRSLAGPRRSPRRSPALRAVRTLPSPACSELVALTQTVRAVNAAAKFAGEQSPNRTPLYTNATSEGRPHRPVKTDDGLPSR